MVTGPQGKRVDQKRLEMWLSQSTSYVLWVGPGSHWEHQLQLGGRARKTPPLLKGQKAIIPAWDGMGSGDRFVSVCQILLLPLKPFTKKIWLFLLYLRSLWTLYHRPQRRRRSSWAPPGKICAQQERLYLQTGGYHCGHLPATIASVCTCEAALPAAVA